MSLLRKLKSYFDRFLGLLSRKKKIPNDSPVNQPSDQNLSKMVDHVHYVSTHKPKDGYKRPPLEWLYAYLLAILIGYWLADLGVLSVRDRFVAQSVAPIAPQKAPLRKQPLRQNYDIITGRNIFNTQGFIPPPLSGENLQEEDTTQPVPSKLPLKLIGTIVHANPSRSVATIQIGKKINPYLPKDPLESIAQLIKIERFTAVLRNNQNGRLEYIEIRDDGLSLAVQNTMSPKKTNRGPRKQGNTFSLKRSEVNKYIENLPALLQQARAIPVIEPGSGAINGFRLVEIQPGSLYEDLGFKKNDVIKNVNGEAVDSPAKAMELYNSLKTDSNVSIDFDRNGRMQTSNFSID